MDYFERYKNTVDLFEWNLRNYFGNGGFQTLEKGMEYSLFSGGKRIRPVICIESGRLFGAHEADILPFATAIEMIHTYSLIHDDLPCMDNDDLRRGIPTNHKIFGEGNAVLNGDALLNLAYETMLNAIDSEKKLTASRIIAKSSGRQGMCSGQSADLYFEKRQSTLQDVDYINANKTGALLRSAFVVGGVLGNATNDEIIKMEMLGQKYGELFQLTDDILDVQGDTKIVGKTLGKDKAVKKSSFVNVFGVEKALERIEILSKEYIRILKSINNNVSFFENLIVETTKRNF